VHKFIRAPVEGLGGVKNGVMTMGQRKLNFIEWLDEVELAWNQLRVRTNSD
jgi:hypothetical protein